MSVLNVTTTKYMIKYIVYILITGALIGSNYSIFTGFTWADVLCCLLLVLSCINHVLRRWKIDSICKLLSLYLPCMLASAIINGQLANTIFINYFRNYFWGIVAYNALANNLSSMKDIKRLLLISSVYIVIFLLDFRIMLLNTYDNTLNTLDFGYGRNNVAFTALLLAIVFEFLYYSKIVKPYILAGIVLMVFIIVFCASRYAMIMLFLSFILFRIKSNRRMRLSEILMLIVLCGVSLLVFNVAEGFVDSSFWEYSQSYLRDKMSAAGDDFFYMRLITINVKPIFDVLRTENPLLVLLFGVPTEIQHSFFSHTLITTGLMGCICYMYSHIKLLGVTYRLKGTSFFLFIVVMVMFVNDFITNSGFIVGVNSILFGVICATFYRYICIHENIVVSQ